VRLYMSEEAPERRNDDEVVGRQHSSLTSALKTYSVMNESPRQRPISTFVREVRFKNSLDSGTVSPSEKSRNKYFNVSLCR